MLFFALGEHEGYKQALKSTGSNRTLVLPLKKSQPQANRLDSTVSTTLSSFCSSITQQIT
jgi:hypothetical protein